MAGLGLSATELGPVGWLPTTRRALARPLDRHGLRLVGGFVPLVLHDPACDDAPRARPTAGGRLLAAAGADVFVAAVVDRPRLVRARARSTTTSGAASPAPRELEELVAGTA